MTLRTFPRWHSPTVGDGLRFTFRGARTIEQKGAIARAVRQRVWPLLESGQVRPVVHARFPLAQAAAAHRLMEGGTHVGKILLTVSSG